VSERIDAETQRKQIELQPNEIQRQKIETESLRQGPIIALMEVKEKRKLEFQQKKIREKDLMAKKMQDGSYSVSWQKKSARISDWNLGLRRERLNLLRLGGWPRFSSTNHL